VRTPAEASVSPSGRDVAIVVADECAAELSKYNTGNIGALEELFYDPDPYDLSGKVLSRSPIVHVRNVRTPTLIIHGEKDRRVPVGQAYEMTPASPGSAMCRWSWSHTRARGIRSGARAPHRLLAALQRVVRPLRGRLARQVPVTRRGRRCRGS
jgi:hypothetical protein